MSSSVLHNKFERLGAENYYSETACKAFEEDIENINALKKEKNAIILAHNYQRPEIFEVADFIGDSLELARKAEQVKDVSAIIFCGVHFMAETAKILNPKRKVILPNLEAGCSLAEAADAVDVMKKAEELRKIYPNLAVVSYVNTTAEVKAVSDVCVTSGNAVKIVNSIPNDVILFLPDRNLAAYVSQNTSKKIIPWEGECYVHEEIQPDEIRKLKEKCPNAEVLVHPECRTDVLSLADHILSTAGMIKRAKESPSKEFIIVTECGLSDRLLLEIPEKQFYKSCQLCKYMKMITLEDTRKSLEQMAPEIILPDSIIRKAEVAIKRMLEYS